MRSGPKPPILATKEYAASSVFEPANLLREARRQKGLAPGDVPAICLLDPDGDILRALRRAGRATLSAGWACYHTDLHEFDHDGLRFGIIACAVGAPFAVLLAEELFVSGCRFLISMTSAGRIAAPVEHDGGPPPYFVVIDRALRDEGTSYHYLPPAEFADADPALVAQIVAIDSPCTTFFALNVRRPPFDDAIVRLAFAKSFDRATWSREQLGGLGAPIVTFVPPGIPNYDAADDAQAFDVPAARALIARSRYAAGLPSVQLTIPGTSLAKRQFQPVVDAWHSALGVDAQLSPVDAATARELTRSPQNYPQMTVQGWCAAYPDPQDFLSLMFTTTTTVGYTNYANPTYDDLVRRADAETDPSVRAGLYRDAQRILTKDAPAIFASSARSLTLVAARVHGQSLTPLDRAFSQFTLGDLFVPLPPMAR